MQVSNPKIAPVSVPDKPAPTGGGLGMMAALGLGMMPVAHRLQKTESLHTLAKQNLPPNAAAKDVQNWIQQFLKLNKLPANVSLKPGQDVLIPPAMCVQSTGKANPMCGFLDTIDGPSVLQMQQQAAQKLEATLKQFNVTERLSALQKTPPPVPTPEDLEWYGALASAMTNPLLSYKPREQQIQCAERLEKVVAWHETVNQPTRVTRADLKQLPASVQQTLKQWMAQDGHADDLSSLDLAKARPEDVKHLIETLKQQQYPPHAQRLIQTLIKLSDSSQLGVSKRLAYQMNDEHGFMTSSFQPHKTESEELKAYRDNLEKIEKLFSDPKLLEQGRWNLSVQGQQVFQYKPTQSIVKDLNVTFAAQEAGYSRKLLKQKYQFQPENPYDLQAIKAIKDKLKTPEDKANFISHYMNAFYQHPQDNTSWGLLTRMAEKAGLAEQVFFGNPPPLNRLPDGRCLIDCEGFTKLSQILLQTLAPESKSMPIIQPGHIFNVAQIGDQFFVFNNTSLQELKLSPSEVKNFDALQSDYNSRWDRLNPFRQKPIMSQKDFPAIYAYVDQSKVFSDPKQAPWFKGDYLKTCEPFGVLQDAM